MNDATYEAQKARILALSKKWVHSLGFGVWTATYEWHRETLVSTQPLEPGMVALFRIDTEWEFLRIKIAVNLAEVESLSDHDLEAFYLHEWGHAFISIVLSTPKGEARHRAVEHVCTWMGKAFRWVRVAGMKDERKRRRAKKRTKSKASAKEG